MERWIHFLEWDQSRLSLLALLGSTFLLVVIVGWIHWRRQTKITRAEFRSLKAGRRDGGSVFSPSLWIIAPCVILTLVISASIPVEHAAVQNNVHTMGRLYLPHVVEELDNFTFYMEPPGDPDHRVKDRFCDKSGQKPLFDEGQTLKWMKYRVDVQNNCLELLGADCERTDGDSGPCTRR